MLFLTELIDLNQREEEEEKEDSVVVFSLIAVGKKGHCVSSCVVVGRESFASLGASVQIVESRKEIVGVVGSRSRRRIR